VDGKILCIHNTAASRRLTKFLVLLNRHMAAGFTTSRSKFEMKGVVLELS